MAVMPARFDSLGISFQYPENWTLDDSDALLGRKSVSVYSPGGAFWSIAIHSDSADPDELTKTIIDALGQEFDGLEIRETEENLVGYDLVGCNLAFFCLDLTNTARIRTLRFAHSTYTVYCQAEDREYERVNEVFQAMTVSFLNGLKDLRYAE